MATTIQQPDRRLYWGIAIAVFVLLVVALALRSNNMRNASTSLQQNTAPPAYEVPATQGVAPAPPEPLPMPDQTLPTTPTTPTTPPTQ